VSTEKKTANSRLEVLIVEDSPTQAERLRHLLEGQGYTVTVAPDGKQALEAAFRHRPDIIISDIVMPEIDGYALCKTVKSDPKLKELPVILLTSLTSLEDVVKGLECGADNFIRKPYDEKYLLARLRHILINRELRQEQKMQMGVEIHLAGRTHFITSDRQQILDLLISTYEEAIHINEQLQAINKELEAFSYSVSHDLRAPLRHIDGFSKALLDECGDQLDAQGKSHLQRVRESVKRMSELIEDLLRLSRVTRSEMVNERVDLSEMAHAVATDLQKTQPERRAEFIIPPAVMVEGDGRLLRVMLENLIGNAWKFTQKRAQTRIEFGATQHEGRRAYFVRDNGAGFDMTYAGKLFGPFQRLHTAEEFPGTGIGLATVQRIIHRHGGRIWAEGAVGMGATFYFTLTG
jgi:signal transduction histidine kinase